MRVLLTGNSSSSMAWFRLPLMREIIARGHQGWVMSPEDWGIERILETGFSFLPLHQAQGYKPGGKTEDKGSYANPLVDLRSAWAIRRACRVIRPDLVLHYTHKLTVIGVPAARSAGVKRVHGMVTGLGFANLGGDLKANALKQVFHGSLRMAGHLADSMIFLNSDNFAEARAARLAPPERLFMLDGEGVDSDRFQADPPTFEAGEPVFLFVGRLVTFKGAREFVRAARLARASLPRARFVMAGGHDPDHPAAIPSAELAVWREEGIVELPGHVEDIDALLREASAFVLPSYPTEGLPMSIMEAMGMSRPILTTAVPGNRETVVDGKNGFLVANGDHEALADAMIILAGDPAMARRMGEESRRLCVERFDHRVVNGALLAHLGL